MTGYGEATSHSADGTHAYLELRSLNNRYFKAVIRLPDEFEGLEAEIESELRRRLTRGSVTLKATFGEATGAAAHAINHLALGEYVRQLKETPQVAAGEVRIELGALLGLPGVLQPPGNEAARHERARVEFLRLLDKACANLLAMRLREGAALVEDLVAQRDVILDRLKTVAARAPQVVQDYEIRLRQRIEMMLKDADLKVDSVEIIREIAVYAERSDISEEITRLSGHMDQFTQLLTSAGEKPVGRTLDFLAQEMLREANTMASKSGDTTISRAIVEIKGAIDRIKEQVQNIE
ncbi:MAG: YicC/YloC family endoribonuclease [Phycisphaerales bacterium]